MKWLPSRAYDNGIYVVFSNPVGMDDDQLKNGCSMIIDPFGDIIAECRALGNDVVTATFDKAKLMVELQASQSIPSIFNFMVRTADLSTYTTSFFSFVTVFFSIIINFL